MKRIVAFIVITLLGFGVIIGLKGNEINFDGLDKVCFVTDLSYANEENAVVSGNDVYITVSADKAKEIKLNNIKGYVLYFNKTSDKKALLNYFFDYSSDEYFVGNTMIMNGYTSKYSDFRYVDGKKYNAQVAFTEDYIIVGLPMILTGF